MAPHFSAPFWSQMPKSQESYKARYIPCIPPVPRYTVVHYRLSLVRTHIKQKCRDQGGTVTWAGCLGLIQASFSFALASLNVLGLGQGSPTQSIENMKGMWHYRFSLSNTLEHSQIPILFPNIAGPMVVSWNICTSEKFNVI